MNQQVALNFPHDISLSVKREDLLHPHISGNKFRKLKYNLLQAKAEGKDRLLTFGGAFSNHIAATAAAGKEYGFATVGIIRGDELVDKVDDNPTLAFAKHCGMTLNFVSRTAYRRKAEAGFLETLRDQYGDFYPVPEGGTNMLAVKGCMEILDAGDAAYTHIACAVGTGGTIAGLVRSALPHQQILGFPALRGEGLEAEVRALAGEGNWSLVHDYHFGGYGRINARLVAFINDFFAETGIPLDPVYTGKLFFGVIDMIREGRFPQGARILLVHTGGLQGIEGMNKELIRKNLPIIKT